MDKLKEQAAIERLKSFEPEEGYYLAYSGGKDSDCIKILAQLAGVKFKAVHNLTTVDAPETVQYIKSQSDVQIDKAYNSNGDHVTMAGSKHRYAEFMQYPTYQQTYINTFDKMLKRCIDLGKASYSWRNGLDVFRWWIGEDPMQIKFEDLGSEYDFY